MDCEKCVQPDKNGNQTADGNETLIPGLPFDLALSCLARVPRSNHRSMSGVSQSWRNLVRGTELWEARREFSSTEERLYLWMELKCKPRVIDPTHPKARTHPRYEAFRVELHCFDPSLEKWSKLPTMTQYNGVTGYFGGHSAVVSFDGKLFVIGGHEVLSHEFDHRACRICRDVSYFDAKSYCWKKAGGLNVARADCKAAVIDNQLYVFGGDVEGGRTKTAEVYDPITNTWNFVRSMTHPMKMRSSVVLEKKLYGVGAPLLEGPNFNSWRYQGVVFDAHTNEWENMACGLRTGWFTSSTVLNGRIYSSGHSERLSDIYPKFDASEFYGKIWSCTPSEGVWKKFHKLEGELGEEFAEGGLEIVNFCRKLCLISVDSHDEDEWHDDMECESYDQMATISLVMVEVEELVEGPKGQVTFVNRTDIPLPCYQHYERIIKRCQVMTL